MADPIRVDKGPITAYAMAVIGGYTGTYEQFCQDQANFATYATQVHEDMLTTQGYKNDAKDSKDAATLSASAASSSEANALSYKNSAKDSMDAAAGSASDALGYKNDAKDYKDAAAASAEVAAQSAATFSTDKTLSIEDKAADAKATGDKITEINSALSALGLSVVDGMVCQTYTE